MRKALSAALRPRLLELRSAPSGGTETPFQFQLIGQPNQSYIIQATRDLATWVSVSTNITDSTGVTVVSDPQSTQLNWRFYRADVGP